VKLNDVSVPSIHAVVLAVQIPVRIKQEAVIVALIKMRPPRPLLRGGVVNPRLAFRRELEHHELMPAILERIPEAIRHARHLIEQNAEPRRGDNLRRPTRKANKPTPAIDGVL